MGVSFIKQNLTNNKTNTLLQDRIFIIRYFLGNFVKGKAFAKVYMFIY